MELVVKAVLVGYVLYSVLGAPVLSHEAMAGRRARRA